MLKAETILSLVSDVVVPGKRITWPVYDGDDILEAKKVEEYVQAYLRTGTIMPIFSLNLGLNIESVEIEYNDELFTHRIVIEGLVMKMKN